MDTKEKSDNRLLLVFSHGILILFSILCILPIIIVISTSLSPEKDVINHGYRLFPREITFVAYEYIFLNAQKLLHAYWVSFSVTAVGTVVGLLVNAMIAYPLARKDFKWREKISFYVFFTMMFTGGLVPWYMMITSMKLQNTFWVLVVPYLVAAWYILLLRTFFQTVPVEIIESAKIDGSNEFGIFFRMILPLSKPVLATVGLLIIFQYWNDYWLGLLFITDDKLISLQYLFYKIMANLDFYINNASYLPPGISQDSLPKLSSRLALSILTSLPMLFVFPFFQKYFVKGLTVGSVKG
ncbi:carbohydrate ABC transporter permease [Paenibacillus agaridevorans]|uniref:carbohydrate ABC transporter permease n=1 Tax=Paenibacillus agaridevorans TaxID=171404 RepID=UPI000D58E091|nr:carbohydrate ABC transporter permease [Paenibacillus agaridevorans]